MSIDHAFISSFEEMGYKLAAPSLDVFCSSGGKSDILISQDCIEGSKIASADGITPLNLFDIKNIHCPSELKPAQLFNLVIDLSGTFVT